MPSRVEASVVDSVATTRQEIARREADLAQVLELAVELCGQAMEIIEANRVEHDEFLESLDDTVRAAVAASASTARKALPATTVLGGIVVASDDVDLGAIEAGEHSGDGSVEHAPTRDALELPFR